MSKKVLLAGESWMSYTTHVKGFDSFYKNITGCCPYRGRGHRRHHYDR